MRIRRKEVSDDAVINGVLRVLAHTGPRFSLAEAGREVGLTAPRLVQRFGGRAGLLGAVFESWGRTGLTAMEAMTTIKRPLAGYLDWVRAGLAGMSPASVHLSLALQEIATDDPVLRRWYAAHLDRSLDALARLLRRAVAAGELEKTDCRQLAERVSIVLSGSLVLSAGRGASGPLLATLAARELTAALAPYRPKRLGRQRRRVR